MSRYIDRPDEATAAEIGRALIDALLGADGFALGRLRGHLVDYFDTGDVWAADDQRRVILGVLDAKDWFAGPPWLARPYDPADPANPHATPVEPANDSDE